MRGDRSGGRRTFQCVNLIHRYAHRGVRCALERDRETFLLPGRALKSDLHASAQRALPFRLGLMIGNLNGLLADGGIGVENADPPGTGQGIHPLPQATGISRQQIRAGGDIARNSHYAAPAAAQQGKPHGGRRPFGREQFHIRHLALGGEFPSGSRGIETERADPDAVSGYIGIPVGRYPDLFRDSLRPGKQRQQKGSYQQ